MKKLINRTALYRMKLKKYAFTCNVSLNISYCNAERTFIGRKNNYVVFLTLQSPPFRVINPKSRRCRVKFSKYFRKINDYRRIFN